MDISTPALLSGDHGHAVAATRRGAGTRMAVGLFNDSGDAPTVVARASSNAYRRLLRDAGAEVRHAYVRSEWRSLDLATLDDSIAAALASPELRRVFAEIDAVVVIGDTLRDEPSGHLLAILGAAQQMDLPTYLVNATVGDTDASAAILAGLTDCTVRDAGTAERLTRVGVRHRLQPDALFSADFSERAGRDFSGHLVVTDCQPARRVEFTPALAAVRAAWPGMVADYPVDTPAAARDWGVCVADLSTAAAILTGGYEGACLALKAGVPFVVLGPDVDATALIGTVAGYPAAAADTTLPLGARLTAAIAARAWFADAARRWHGRGPVETFSRLRPGFAASGRDDSWTGSIDDVVAAAQAVTPKGGSVLHAGAGQGRVVEALARVGLRAWGADVARRLDRPDRNRYSAATPRSLPFADHVFSTVVVSAAWLEHLDASDLEVAVAELARVGRDSILVEVSGRPPRAERMGDGRGDADSWQRRLVALGLRTRELPIASRELKGPTGGVLVAMSAPVHLCPSCQRAQERPDIFEPVHPGVLTAAALPRRFPRLPEKR